MAIELDTLFNETISTNIKSLTYIANYNHKSYIDQWTTSLGTFDLGEAAKQTLITLLELRRLDCPDLIRFELLQQIETNLVHLSQALEHHYLSNSLLDTKRDQQISDLVLEIKAQHALIYLDIFKRSHTQLDNDQFSFFEFSLKKKLNLLRKQAALLTLTHLTDLLYSLQQLYFDTPRKFWQSAYFVFYIACEHSFECEPIEHVISNPLINTLHKAFAHLILQNILNHHKLRQLETRDLMVCTPYWTDLITFNLTPQPDSKYYFEYQKDDAPKLYHYGQYLNQSDDLSPAYYISVYALLNYIDSTLKPNSRYYAKQEENALTVILKHHIQSVLSVDLERLQPRFVDEGTLDLCLGISSAHFFLSNHIPFKETLTLQHQYTVQNSAIGSFNALEDESSFMSSRSHEQDFNTEINKVYQVSITNRSETGYGVKWHHKSVKRLRTGEFILIRTSSDDAWTGGVIRWIKNTNHYFIEFGIELLASRMCPVAVSINKVNVTHIYHPAVVMENQNGDYMLVLPSSQIFYSGQTLNLRFASQELRIFLKSSIVLTQGCATFHFDLLEQSKLPVLKDFFEQYVYLSNLQDPWESLK